MTAHELARKLLEGPDVPVAAYDTILDGGEEDVWFADGVEYTEVWQWNETTRDGEPRWSAPSPPNPFNQTADPRRRSVQVVRIR